jgi:hypothetical protein
MSFLRRGTRRADIAASLRLSCLTSKSHIRFFQTSWLSGAETNCAFTLNVEQLNKSLKSLRIAIWLYGERSIYTYFYKG